jgi:hypothetical protein
MTERDTELMYAGILMWKQARNITAALSDCRTRTVRAVRRMTDDERAEWGSTSNGLKWWRKANRMCPACGVDVQVLKHCPACLSRARVISRRSEYRLAQRRRSQ